MQADTTIIKNEWHTDFQGRTRIHATHQKKQKSTKQRMKKPTPMKIEKAWKCLHAIADMTWHSVAERLDSPVNWTRDLESSLHSLSVLGRM